MKEIPENVNNAIQEFIKGTQEILGDRLKQIILYGSYARGDFNEGSDVDIMILTDLTDEEIDKYRGKIYDLTSEIAWDNDFKIDLSPLIKNIDKFNYWLEGSPFYMNVQKEGVILNESKSF